MNPDAVRSRLREKIVERFGQVGAGAIREIAAIAGLNETTLGRFVAPEQYSNPTRRPRDSTLRACATALGVNYQWLRDGQGVEQLGVWPTILADLGESEPSAPLDELRSVIDELPGLRPDLEARVARSAVAAIVAVVADAGDVVPPIAYRALIRLGASTSPQSTADRRAS